jgi:GDPmannose 4,6-dehydratase
LDAIKESGIKSRFYQASTSELYGNTPTEKQNEESPFCPRSPYAAAKLYAYWTVVNYREAYNLHASNGILFNHESPRRGGTFVTKKITMGLANILAKKQEKIYLGNLSAKRDWGYAPDYVEAMWMMLQQEKPDDYVIATGESHSVKEFAEKAFALAGMNLVWKGSGNQEKGIDKKTNRTLIEIDPYYYRPTDVDELVGDAKKARKKLGWKPKVSFDELVKIMVHADCEKAGIRLK